MRHSQLLFIVCIVYSPPTPPSDNDVDHFFFVVVKTTVDQALFPYNPLVNVLCGWHYAANCWQATTFKWTWLLFLLRLLWCDDRHTSYLLCEQTEGRAPLQAQWLLLLLLLYIWKDLPTCLLFIDFWPIPSMVRQPGRAVDGNPNDWQWGQLVKNYLPNGRKTKLLLLSQIDRPNYCPNYPN